MATPQSNLERFQEIKRRGLQDQLPPNIRSRFDEAERRGLLGANEPQPEPPVETLGAPRNQISWPTNQPQSVQGLVARSQRDTRRENLAAMRPSTGENVLGLGEAAGTFGTGALSSTAAGIAGSLELLYRAARGEEGALQSAIQTIESISQGGTYQPRTEAGQDALEAASVPFEKLSEVSQGAGNRVLDATRSPTLATATQVGIESLPAIAPPFARSSVRANRRSTDVGRVESEAQNIGLNIDADPVQRTQQLVDSADRQASGQRSAGENIEVVRDSVIAQREQANQRVNDLYTVARQEGAGVSVRDNVVVDIFSRADDQLRDQGFPVEDMQKLQGRIKRLDEIINRSDGEVNLNDLETWRKTLNRSRVANDPEQNRALGVLRDNYDQVMGDLFNSDMISGDPAAIQRWVDAREARKEFVRRFDSDRTIQNLSREDATAREVKNWILGANSVNALGPSVRTVTKIKDMFGADSPEMQAIRAEMAFDVVGPLFDKEPDFNAFIRNYDNMTKKNNRLAREVFGDETLNDIASIRRFAGSVRDNTSSGLGLDPTAIGVRMLFGNSLSKNQAKIRTAVALLKQAGKTVFSGSERQQIISGVLGYDISRPVFSFSANVAPAGVVQTGISQEDN